MSIIDTYLATLNDLRDNATQEEQRRAYGPFDTAVKAAWKPISEALCDPVFVAETKARKVALMRDAIAGDWATKNIVAGLWGWGVGIRAAEHFTQCSSDPFFVDIGGHDPEPMIDCVTEAVRNLTGLGIKATIKWETFPSGGKSPFLEFRLLGA